MRTNVTKLFMCIILLTVFVFSETQAQIYVETGKIGFRLTDYGAIRLFAPSTNDDRQLDRVNIIAAVSKDAVSDYNEDHNSTIAAYLVESPAKADTELVVEFNSEYAPKPPKVYYRLHVYSWVNEAFIIARYTVINDSNQQVTMYLGAVSVPQVAGSYGGETNSYNSGHQTAFCYRTGDTYYSGLRFLSSSAYSYHALDWDVYSPDDPDNDAAVDSTRYHMTADPGFDTTTIAGGDGSIFSLNAGAYTLAAGDSAVVYLAIACAAGENDLMLASDAAQAKYDNVFTAIDKPGNPEIPTSIALQQNYPNPFNPGTTIQFTLDKGSDILLNVYNLNGQLVNTIAAGSYSAGQHMATWNGKDSHGNEVASGIYLYRLTVGSTSFTKKMVLVR
jgi:hypothetical protein